MILKLFFQNLQEDNLINELWRCNKDILCVLEVHKQRCKYISNVQWVDMIKLKNKYKKMK